MCVIELGGTIGDIESMPFVEALRQFQFRVGRGNICFLHVSLVPLMGEQKTKPTQHSVQQLRSLGLSPDFIMCRSKNKLEEATKQKISYFCQPVSASKVIGVHDVNDLYAVPILLQSQSVDQLILEHFGRKYDASLSARGFRYWRELEERSRLLSLGLGSLGASGDRSNSNAPTTVKIALVGKYTNMADAYLSVTKALQHSCLQLGRVLQLLWIEATELEPGVGHKAEAERKLHSADGILVPGGFGERGVEGMIRAAQYARENNVPYLGVCLGFQVGVIEFARNVLHWEGAHSTEFDQRTPHPVVIFMPEGDAQVKGGTMRLGARDTVLLHQERSKLFDLYGKQNVISERHRHRYEVEPKIVSQLEEKGMLFVGRAVADHFLESDKVNNAQSTDSAAAVETLRNEAFEVDGLSYFVGVQFHSEFKSTPLKPSPPFVGLIKAAIGEYSK